MPSYDNDDLLDRAHRAYYASGGTDEPSRGYSDVVEHRGRSYVVLANVRGTLAAYRVTPAGTLRRTSIEAAS